MTTYYVRASGGDDGNDGLSFANGWATIQHAFDTAVAGDQVRICNDGTHSPTAQVDIDTNSGSSTSGYIHFIGASATGTLDGSIATISGASLPASTDLLDSGTSSIQYICLENLRLTNGTKIGVNLYGSSQDYWKFVNVRIDNMDDAGLRYDSDYIRCYGCEFDNNAGSGFVGSTKSGHIFVGCSSHDNSEHGFNIKGNYNQFFGCLAYDNVGSGFYCLKYAHQTLINCVADRNDDDGIEFDDTVSSNGDIDILNCILRANGGYGIRFGNFAHESGVVDYNCYYNNTSGACDVTTPGNANITSDPQFTSVTDGSEDYSLQSGSPCRGVGLGGPTS